MTCFVDLVKSEVKIMLFIYIIGIWFDIFIKISLSIYVSVKWAIIGSGNGLLPFQHQAITWTNDDLLSIGPQEHTSMKFELKFKIFQENAFENIVYIMSAVDFRFQCVYGDDMIWEVCLYFYYFVQRSPSSIGFTIRGTSEDHHLHWSEMAHTWDPIEMAAILQRQF